MIEFKHQPVMLKECIENLNIKKDGVYVDATVGGAGHSYHILEVLDESGYLYCFDQDINAIEAARKHLQTLSKQNYSLINVNFSNMKEALNYKNTPIADGILFDLGVSSFQLDEPSRGFSYRYDAKLDMRMNQNNSLSAYDVVNRYKEEDLTRILFEYGEEKYARRIASNIVTHRKNKPIETTLELVEIIKNSVPSSYIRETHPAKKSFQAIRIEVNNELGILKQSLEDALALLKPYGRLVVITFHSLEDRIVKQLFKEKSSEESWHRGMPVNISTKPCEFKLITNKPLTASNEELEINNRSHSAKVRVIERI